MTILSLARGCWSQTEEGVEAETSEEDDDMLREPASLLLDTAMYL